MATLSNSEIAAMRATVLDVSLDHVCTIQRRTQSGVDPDNQPIFDWVNHLVGIPCHFWEEDEEELVATEQAVVVKRRMTTRATEDITTDDRVVSLIGYDGEQIASEKALDIKEVLKQVNHKLLALEVVERND